MSRSHADILHESVVWHRIEFGSKNPYLEQEWKLNATISFSIYALLIMMAFAQQTLGHLYLILGFGIMASHFLFSFLLLYYFAKLKDPLRHLRKGVHQISEKGEEAGQGA